MLYHLCLQVYVMYIALLLSALNKLPLKLPQNSAGRRHNQKSSASEPITFDDVAGVDEAKEELAEVVVSILVLTHMQFKTVPSDYTHVCAQYKAVRSTCNRSTTIDQRPFGPAIALCVWALLR